MVKNEETITKVCHQFYRMLAKTSAYQRDQIAYFFVEYLAIYNNEILPNSITIAKLKSIFCQILNNLTKMAKVAKFLQIWSHWCLLLCQMALK